MSNILNKNPFLIVAINAVEVIAMATKHLELSTDSNACSHWRLFQKRANVQYREAMHHMGMSSTLPQTVLNMNRDEITAYLKQRISSNMAMKKYRSSKNNSTHAAAN